MRLLFTWIVFGALASHGQVSHMRDEVLSETTTKVSDHVWVIRGYPNVALIVGAHATLAVDTGLGPRNGATVARVATRLAPNNEKLFLTTTHFHPEHASGASGFPAGTVLIRNRAQQVEMDEHGQEMIDLFRSMSSLNKDLLDGVVLRPPDVVFDREAVIDLGGGVRARLLWFGAAHTKGDELTLVEPDNTLISGDVVQNKTIPYIYGVGGTPSSWLDVLDKIATLNIAHVVPDHSAPGDGMLVAAERELISTIRTRALALKRQGVPADAAGKRISADLKGQHPDWTGGDVSDFVKRVYADSDSTQ